MPASPPRNLSTPRDAVKKQTTNFVFGIRNYTREIMFVKTQEIYLTTPEVLSRGYF
jgi:hypothetical protein